MLNCKQVRLSFTQLVTTVQTAIILRYLNCDVGSKGSDYGLQAAMYKFEAVNSCNADNHLHFDSLEMVI